MNPGNSSEKSATVVTAYSDSDVEEVVRRARVAQETWGRTSLAERRAVLQEILDEVLLHEKEICAASIRDSGKTKMEAEYGEILTTCEKIRYLVAHGHKAIRPESRSPPLMMWFVKRAWVEYSPMGVIGIIVPWNYPFHNVASAVTAALFAGNAAVVKVSEYASASKDLFEGLFRRVLARRGHSQDLVTLMAGFGPTGAALCACPGVDKIHFIGSDAVGRKVMQAAAANATPVVLELGGKDPFIVLDDADLAHAADVALRGVFVNNGQNCIAAERVFVHQTLFDRFCDLVVPKVRAMSQGDSSSPSAPCFDCGAITMEPQLRKVEELVEDARSKGADVLCGGCRLEGADGLFYRPTVLTNLNDDMRIVNEETFGPVMLIRSFASDDEAVRLANSSPYGLGSSIFSANRRRAESMAHEIRAGMATINDFGVSYLIQDLPFGGVGLSGFGRFNGPEGLREFSRQKTVVSDRFNLLTQAPDFTKFPIPPYAPQLVSSAINMIYNRSYFISIKSGLNMFNILKKKKVD